MNFTTTAWIWLYIGAFLMLAELATPGFVIFFFGLGATTVALLKWLIPGMSLAWQLALFSVLSVAYLVLLRRWIKTVFMGETADSDKIENEYVGRIGKVIETTGPDVPGRIILGDTEWSACSDSPIAVGTAVKVVKKAGLTFTVVAI